MANGMQTDGMGLAAMAPAAARKAGLWQPFRAGGLTLPNRFVMAPMTRRRSPGGIPGADVAAYYARRAAGGTGLIITEGTYVDHPTAGGSDAVPRFDAATGPAWRRVVEQVHAAGAAIFPQLWHIGTGRDPGAPPFPHAAVLGPSGLDLAGEPKGRAATTGEIAELVDAYARGAALAQRTGFDGVEVHGAHGYLVDQFLWERTNRRTDGYGGDAGGRARFAAEIVAAIRTATGPDFPIAFRFSQWKVHHYEARIADDPDALRALLAPIADAGVSMFHVSVRRYWEPAFAGSDRTLAGWTRQLFGLPTITVGSVGLVGPFVAGPEAGGAVPATDIAPLIDRFEAGEFDLVAVGRALIADPDWVAKVRDGRSGELVGFTPEATRTLV